MKTKTSLASTPCSRPLSTLLRTACATWLLPLLLLLLLLLLTLPAVVQAQFTYTNSSGVWSYWIANGTAAITGYSGPGDAVNIPSTINRLQVTRIRDSALDVFFCPACSNFTSVTIPGSVTNIENEALRGCAKLISVYFAGNAPSLGPNVFGGDTNATAYYLPGTSGWSPTFDGIPTALWLPQVQRGNATFGVRTNQFGFSSTWASGRFIVVEACTELANPNWSPVSTNILTDGSSYFSDPQWANHPARFYRLRSP